MEHEDLERVDGLTLSNCLFLISQGWAKHAGGDKEGGLDCLDRAILMTPPGTVDLILEMIRSGELPVPGPDTMKEWIELCRQARAGEFTMTIAELAGWRIPVARISGTGDGFDLTVCGRGPAGPDRGVLADAIPPAGAADLYPRRWRRPA